MRERLTSNRLLLEPLCEHDAAFILELLNSEGWLQFIGDRKVGNIADAINYIEKINSNLQVVYWVARRKDDLKAIGVVTLIKRDYLEHKDIGFAFLPVFSGKGFAYEATQTILQHLVNDLSITQMQAVVLPGNIASIKLLEKLGMRLEKEWVVENEILHIYGAPIKQLVLAHAGL